MADRDYKKEVGVLEGNIKGMRKELEKLTESNKKLLAESEKNKGLANQLKAANQQVDQLSGQKASLDKQVGKTKGDFPKLPQGAKLVSESQISENESARVYRIDPKGNSPLHFHVTVKDGKGTNAHFTQLR